MDVTLSQTMTDVKGYIDSDQVQKIINLEPNERNRLLLVVLWNTGCRAEEIVGGILHRKDKETKEMMTVECKGLEVENIDWAKKRLLVPNLKSGKKNINYKDVPVTKECLELLREYIRKNNITEKVFDLSRSQVFRIVKYAGIRAGFSKVGLKKSWLHPHHFRHSLGIHLLKHGMALPKIQEILGHSNISSTGFYLRFGKSETEEDYHKIMG